MTLNSRRKGWGELVKRSFDILLSIVALAFTTPVLLAAAIGVRLSSPGPVFYRAKRVGLNAKQFSMLKFRTMRLGADREAAITAPEDSRVFPFGAVLRKLKIDELPQFWNILKGDMSIVGPRPEDPLIVARAYTDWMLETLTVRPGVTSPGAVYGYLYGDDLLDSSDPESSYERLLLPTKLALERAYIERAGFISDLGYIALTVAAIAANILGRRVPLPARELEGARKWAPEGPY